MRQVILPKRLIHSTPMPLKTDAYTAGSNSFQSDKAKEKSTYYGVHRKHLKTINPALYGEDDRIVFIGLNRALERLFREAATAYDIDESVASLSSFKITKEGMKPYDFPRELWMRVVNEFNGRPPILIEAPLEGSVVYPQEPFVQVTSLVDGFGEFAAWVESRLLNTYGATERVTQNEHFLLAIKERILKVNPEMPKDQLHFYASNMLVDFSDRAGFNHIESEDLGEVHLYTFPGTDNLAGNYQAYKNAGNKVMGGSILALAHRNVQAFDTEEDCYKALYAHMDNNNLASFVADLNDYYVAVETKLIPLILDAKAIGNGKTIVLRPDSGDVIIQLIWTLHQLELKGLTSSVTYSTGKWKTTPWSSIILADGLTFIDMLNIMDTLINEGYEFWTVNLFGSGGGLRNGLKRDNLSSKFALCAKGKNNEPVAKFSEDLGKGTLPGPFKVLRSKEALESKVTIVGIDEPGESHLVPHFNGLDIWDPFKIKMENPFLEIQARIRQQMETLPKTMVSDTNGGCPASESLKTKRLYLMKLHAYDKYRNLIQLQG